MRTTLTLDDDVAAKLKSESRRSGRPFKEIVNDTLRSGLSSRRARRRPLFKVAARDLGAANPGLSLEGVSGLIERIEGPFHP